MKTPEQLKGVIRKKVDVTTGDKITPAAIQYDYPFI